MRKIFILSLLLAFAIVSFCQKTVQKQHWVQSDYLQKSKKQKKTGTILLIGGAGLIITSFIIPKGELVYDGICVGYLCDDKYKNDGIKSGFFIAGGVAALSSIPFFIASGKNRRKANEATAFIDIEKKPVLHGMTLSKQSFPAIGLRIVL